MPDRKMFHLSVIPLGASIPIYWTTAFYDTIMDLAYRIQPYHSEVLIHDETDTLIHQLKGGDEQC